MKRFLQLSRAPFFTAIIAPCLFGTALAWNDTHQMHWLPFALVMVGLIAAHAGANLFNDYFDFKLGADQINRNRNQFSGGSPHIVEGREKPKVFFAFGVASFAVTLICGVLLVALVDGGPGPILWLGLAGLATGFFYTAPPFKLAYRGLGEICIFIAFGVLPVLGAYYAQTKWLSLHAVLVSVPLGLLITNILWINEFPDYESDKAAGKRHLVVKLGLSASRFVYYFCSLGAFALIGWFAASGRLTPWTLLSLIALPFALAACAMLHRRFMQPKALVPAQGLTIITHLLTGLLLTAGLLIG